MQLKSKSPHPTGAVKPNPNVIFRKLGDEIVLFHLDTDRFYELNGTAARFWELLNSEASPTQACEQMVNEFSVDRDQLSDEVEKLLTSLRHENLVSVDE